MSCKGKYEKSIRPLCSHNIEFANDPNRPYRTSCIATQVPIISSEDIAEFGSKVVHKGEPYVPEHRDFVYPFSGG